MAAVSVSGVTELLLVALVLVLSAVNFDVLANWRLSLRRELALHALISDVSSHETYDEQLVAAAIARGVRALQEEHDAQARWRSQPWWRRLTDMPPDLGERWQS